MCIALWYVIPANSSSKSRIKFALLFNREEFSERSTQPLGMINDSLVGGRDLQEGGTWLCINADTGVIAFLTNRNMHNQRTWGCKLKFFIQMMIDIVPLKIQKFLHFPQFKSRGKLIIDLCSRIKGAFKPKEVVQHPNKVRSFKTVLKATGIEDLKQSYQEAVRMKNQYRPFNLIYGSIVSQQFHYLCQSNAESSKGFKLEHGYGSVCSYSDLGDELMKQRIAKQKFRGIIEDGCEEEEMVRQLFELGTQEFRSNEAFFKAMPRESTFFIPEYRNLAGKLRGTRTTTVVLFDGNELKVFEKTYI